MPSIELQIKEGFEKVNNDFENFKKENDERLETLEKNKGTSDYDEKLEKLNSMMDEKSQKIEELQTAINRANLSGPEAEMTEKDAKERKDLARKAMQKLMKKRSPNFSEEEIGALNSEYPEAYDEIKEFKALSVNSDADGGYFVRPEVDSNIRKKLFESSPLRQLSTVQTISSDSIEIYYDDDEPAANWVGEAESRTETSNAKVKVIEIPTHELHAAPKATQKLLDDASINIEAWHQGKVSSKFARAEASGFISGTGVKQPKGILSYAAGDGFDKLEQINSGSAGAFAADGLIDLQTSLFEEFQANATWLMRRASAGAIRKLKNADGSYLWSFDPNGGLNASPMEMLLGKPVRFANDMQAVGSNALAAAYGDFRQGYLVVDRVGVRVLRDPYTSKPFIVFDTTKRVGGGVVHFQAIKLQKLAA